MLSSIGVPGAAELLIIGMLVVVILAVLAIVYFVGSGVRCPNCNARLSSKGAHCQRCGDKDAGS